MEDNNQINTDIQALRIAYLKQEAVVYKLAFENLFEAFITKFVNTHGVLITKESLIETVRETQQDQIILEMVKIYEESFDHANKVIGDHHAK